MTADVDLHGAALLVGRSASFLQKKWRTLTHGETGAPFPRPYIGAGKGQQARWTVAAIEAWKAGAAPAAGDLDTAGHLAQREPPAIPANDPRPRPVTDRLAALKAAAGG